jgi:hypothetical protein
VHEARFLAHLLRHPVEEGDHVMLGHRFDRVDRGDVDGGLVAHQSHSALAALCGTTPRSASFWSRAPRSRTRCDISPPAPRSRSWQGGRSGGPSAAPAGDAGAARARARRDERRRLATRSDQPLGLQRGVPLAPDDHVIVDGHAQQPPGLGDALGDLDVGAAGLRVAAGVVVDEDQRARADVQPGGSPRAGGSPPRRSCRRDRAPARARPSGAPCRW